jgi:hypothetical protein
LAANFKSLKYLDKGGLNRRQLPPIKIVGLKVRLVASTAPPTL